MGSGGPGSSGSPRSSGEAEAGVQAGVETRGFTHTSDHMSGRRVGRVGNNKVNVD